jgi:archaemetzincin
VSVSGSAPFERRVLHLLPLGLQTADDPLVSWLGSALARRTGVRAVQDPPLPVDRAWLDPARGQCSSNRVVDALIDRAGGRAGEEWTLALTAADLYAPGRDFVFGEAALGGAWAVVSLARLDGPAAGGNPDALRSRLLIESLHELGHLAGLHHCSRPRCAMARAILPEHVDSKDPAFCAECLAALRASPAEHRT